MSELKDAKGGVGLEGGRQSDHSSWLIMPHGLACMIGQLPLTATALGASELSWIPLVDNRSCAQGLHKMRPGDPNRAGFYPSSPFIAEAAGTLAVEGCMEAASRWLRWIAMGQEESGQGGRRSKGGGAQCSVNPASLAPVYMKTLDRRLVGVLAA